MNQTIAKLIINNVPPIVRLLRHEMRKNINNTLTIPQFRLLLRLEHTPSSQNELANWLGVTPPSMSKMINSLLKNKLITREYDKNNRRKQIIALTKKGLSLIKKQQKSAIKMFAEAASTLSKSDKQKLKSGLEILIKLVDTK